MRAATEINRQQSPISAAFRRSALAAIAVAALLAGAVADADAASQKATVVDVPANAPIPAEKAPPIDPDAGAGKPASGDPTRVSGTSPVDGGAPRRGASISSQEGGYPYSTTANPARQVGKLKLKGGDGSWSWCSASIVASANKSTVVTAGHCVKDDHGRWAKAGWFCPGHQAGRCPLGSWPVRRFVTTNQYANSRDSRYDFALALTQNRYRRSGSWHSGTVGAIAGTQGIAFNQTATAYRWAMGYPTTDSRWPGARYDPNYLTWCPQRQSSWESGQGMLFIWCGMTGGSSGGPWISWPNGEWIGYVNSLQSNKGCVGSRCADYDYGPYFGNEIEAVWDFWQKR
jgi:V8-like Glu-specific endopeptidase